MAHCCAGFAAPTNQEGLSGPVGREPA